MAEDVIAQLTLNTPQLDVMASTDRQEVQDSVRGPAGCAEPQALTVPGTLGALDPSCLWSGLLPPHLHDVDDVRGLSPPAPCGNITQNCNSVVHVSASHDWTVHCLYSPRYLQRDRELGVPVSDCQRHGPTAGMNANPV